MGTAWSCHYKRNTPGYVNPFELCSEELQDMLVCSDPLYNRPINVSFSGYYLGLPVDQRASNSFYSNSSGLFIVRTTTGVNETPIGNAYVRITFTKYSPGTEARDTLLSTSVYTQSNGYASGLFLFPNSTGNGQYSGVALALSGDMTGIATIDSYYYGFPPPYFVASTNAISRKAFVTVGNPDSTNTFGVSIQRSINDNSETAYSTIATLTLDPSQTYEQEYDIAPGDFHYYRGSYQPAYCRKAIASEGISGGFPPALTSLALTWLYKPDAVVPSPYLRINMDSTLYHRYNQGSNAVEVTYMPDGGSWTQAGLTQVSEYRGGYWLMDLSELSIGKYKFRASGAFADSSLANQFYSNSYLETPLLDLGGIYPTASTSNRGCGVDIRWEGPSLAEGYEIHISESLDMQNPTVGYPIQPNYFYFYHNTISNCGAPYYYQVCSRAEPSKCSDVVSGSGSLHLGDPYVVLYPKYANPDNIYPTTQFKIHLDWGTYQDPFAEWISGERIDFVNDNEMVKFYAVNRSNTDDPEGGTLSLVYDQRNPIQYNLAFVSGLITGTSASFLCLAPRQPITPSSLVVTPNGGNVDLTWQGDITDPWDGYLVIRSGVSNPSATVTFKSSAPNYTDTPTAGTWKYGVVCYSLNAAYQNFTGFSSWVMDSSNLTF